jgi:cytochrome c biogenesis factor
MDFLRNHQGRKMNFSARNIDKKKAFTGAILVCLAVFMMLFEGEGTPFFMKAIRVVVLSVGLGFYVWGRFFSRGGA